MVENHLKRFFLKFSKIGMGGEWMRLFKMKAICPIGLFHLWAFFLNLKYKPKMTIFYVIFCDMLDKKRIDCCWDLHVGIDQLGVDWETSM